jgi:hypothetical protein
METLDKVLNSIWQTTNPLYINWWTRSNNFGQQQQ